MNGPILTRAFDEDDHGRKVAIRTGQHFELRLPENPMAGYRWRLVESGEPVCALAGERFDPGKLPGQPGVHVWRFRIRAAGSARIELGYRRSWEGEAPAAETFSLEVKGEV